MHFEKTPGSLKPDLPHTRLIHKAGGGREKKSSKGKKIFSTMIFKF